MLDLIANELRKLLLSMRFQILLGVGLILFLFAAWSGAARYQIRQEAFAQFSNLELERFGRVVKTRAWNDFVLQLARPPAPTDLVHDGKSDYLPDTFGFNPGVPERAHYSSSLRYNFAIPKFNRLDWTFIVSYLFTFGALALSFDAVTAEREEGTLRLLCSYPVARHKIILAKHLAVMTATLSAVATGALASFGLFSYLSGARFNERQLVLLSFWLIGVTLSISAHASLALLLSTVCRHSSHSLHASVAVWVVLLVGVPSAAQLVARAVHPTRTATEVGEQITLTTSPKALARDRGQMPTPEQRAARSREIAELYNLQLKNNLNQVLLAVRLSKFSPDAIMNDSLSRSFQTGIYGLQAFAAETALVASSFSEQLRRDPDGLQHPIVSMAEQWRPSEPPPWTDWGLLAALSALILTAACLVFEASDLD